MTNNGNKQYYIPMEVTSETIRDFNLNPDEVLWSKIGNRNVRVIMIPVTREQYYEYMRPLWREDKKLQRRAEEISLDALYEENEYEFPDKTDVASDVEKKMMIEKLHEALLELDKIDRTIMEMYSENHTETEIGKVIGMSQRGVNKRKHKVILKLRSRLKDFK